MKRAILFIIIVVLLSFSILEYAMSYGPQISSRVLIATITNPKDNSATNSVEPFWINATTNVNATCLYGYEVCPWTNDPGAEEQSDCGLTFIEKMSNTGGTEHSQLIIADLTPYDPVHIYNISVECSNQFSSDGDRVTYFIDTHSPLIEFDPSTPEYINITPIKLVANFVDWGTGIGKESCEICTSLDGTCDDEWTLDNIKIDFDYKHFNGSCSYSWNIWQNGTYNVSYRVKDVAGNIGIVSKEIIVEDLP